MEKAIVSLNRRAYLEIWTLPNYQVVYQSDKAPAIHVLTSTIEWAIEANQVAFVAFIDIEGAVVPWKTKTFQTSLSIG